jgi:outer membrane protein assembly factor BamB
MTRFTPLFLSLSLTLLAGWTVAADWPQWRGPDRDNVSRETGLLKAWPSGGPKLLWTTDEAGIGYSGFSVVGDRLFTMGSDGNDDLVEVFDTKTGKKGWSTPIGKFVENRYGSGPRGTPTVDGERVFALSADGHLACLETATGKLIWSVSLLDLGGHRPNWNYSESPLVDGDKVICTPGGGKGTLAALDKMTGKVLWRSTDVTDDAGYASPIIAEVGGIRQYVQLTMKGVVGVAAQDGHTLWYYRNPRYRTAVIPTAIFHDNNVYAVAGYGAGCVLLHLVPDGSGGIKAEQVYEESATRLMDNKHGGVVRVGDYVFGWSDREGWLCQEFKTGKKVWASRALPRGSVTCAEGCLYCYSEDNGTVTLVPASPDGWQEKGRFILPREAKDREFNNSHWTHPVVANGRLYLRDQELIFCYDIKNGGAP